MRLAWVLAGVACIAIVAATALVARSMFFEDLRERTEAALALYSAGLEGRLEKYRLLAPIIARRTDVVTRFQNPVVGAGDRMAGEIARMSGADDVAFVDPTGAVFARGGRLNEGVLSATDRDLRPHVLAALEGRLGRHHAYDATTGKRNYFFAAPVRRARRVLGAVVVRVGLEVVEQDWALSKNAIIAVDPAGVVFLSNRRHWRLSRFTDSSARAESALIKIPSRFGAQGTVRLKFGDDPVGPSVMEVDRRLPLLGWTLYTFADTSIALSRTISAATIAALISLIGLIGLWISRERLRSERLVAIRLERRVRARTRELIVANRKMAREVEERRAAEEELKTTQAELIQSAKLATIGQMSATLSHEFNQPLASIQSYAENAEALIDHGRTDEARENMSRIGGLVARLGKLNRNLKAFARKPGTGASSVAVKAVLDESLNLVSAQAKRAGVTIEVVGDDMVVIAGPLRLSQVLVNLIGNAVDACAEQASAQVAVALDCEDGYGRIRVSDNGPGIKDDALARLFEPFFTTKTSAKGLGLGLSIADKIVREFGGRLEAANRDGGGAVFTVTLKLADAESLAEAAE